MADNVAITAGTGTTIAADELTDGTLGSCKVQYVKIMDGTIDGTDKLTITTAGGMLVNLGSNNDVTVTSGTITTVSTVTTCSTVTTLSQFGGNAINLGAGSVGTGTLRITLASDDPAVAKLTTIDADTSGLFACVAGTEVQVDIVGALPAGTNAIGKLAANSGVDIGDVDVTSLIPGTGATSMGKAIDSAAGSTDTGVAVLAIRDDALSSITPAEGDWTGLRVDANGALWVAPHAVTNAGTFAVQVDGSALTALQLIDDPVLADDAAFTPGTTKVMMAGFEADEGSTDSVDEGDAGAARMTLDRKQIVTTQPHTAGGLSIFRSLDLDETEEEVKGEAGQIYKIRIANFATSPRYIKIYDNTAAETTVGSTTPIDTIVMPGATSSSYPVVLTEAYGGLGLTCSTGITVAATTALADADTGAPSANDVVVTVLYK